MMRLRIKKDPFRLSLGVRGEMAAWGYLSQQGFKFLDKNYRCAIGELDVVAVKAGALHFIEIKTRRHHEQGRPEEAVDLKKQIKLGKLALWYLRDKKPRWEKMMFSVLAITWPENAEPHFRLIENAFELPESE